MTPPPYIEDQLVEQLAIGLFAALGWQTVCALEETFGTFPPTSLPEGEGRNLTCDLLLPRLLSAQVRDQMLVPS